VATAAPFPKPRIPELMTALRDVHVEAPVAAGQVIMADALGTGIAITASRSIEQL
jgi:CxxC motif-containing protein